MTQFSQAGPPSVPTMMMSDAADDETRPLRFQADEASRPPRRNLVGCLALTMLAFALMQSSRTSVASTAELSTAGAQDLDDDSLYQCTMGRPSVATAYANGSWGTIEGQWYVVAGKYKDSSSAAGDCCRMEFRYNDRKQWLNQWMMYNNDDTYYFWNYTGNTYYHEEGLWYNYGESDDNGGISYKNFWSNVFLTGTHDGARWFGWYECGVSSNSVTADGIPWILSEDKDAHKDDSFTAMIAEQMSEVLTWDDDATYSFTVYNQTDCDYTWHRIANDHGDRR